jgi:hypothetical protein
VSDLLLYYSTFGIVTRAGSSCIYTRPVGLLLSEVLSVQLYVAYVQHDVDPETNPV